MVDDFEVYLAYSLRPQTPKNYKEFLDKKVHLIKMKNVGVKGLSVLRMTWMLLKNYVGLKEDSARCDSFTFICCRWIGKASL